MNVDLNLLLGFDALVIDGYETFGQLPETKKRPASRDLLAAFKRHLRCRY